MSGGGVQRITYYCRSMLAVLKTRWALLLILAVFIICKVPHLFYPYYWDESWPYAVAIKDMFHHGVSLMPTAVDPELSRGHPLFFHAAAALWMRIFGDSHVAMHSFSLLISVVFLVSVYEAGIRLFNARVALLGTLLVAIQVVFFVQASFVLFEMLVAFLCFTSLYYYSIDKYVMTVLCLTALFYTKESGLIAGFTTGVAAIAGMADRNTGLKTRLYRLASVFVPCVLIGIFFIIQKHTRGWYIFPFYNGLIEHSWTMFWYNFRINSMNSTIIRDNRYYYFIVLLLLSIVAAIKNKSFKYLVIFFPAVIVYYFADDKRAGRPLPSMPFFVLFIISITWMLYVLQRLKVFSKGPQQRFIVLSCAFIFLFFCFSAMNFFTPRYMLAAIVPLLFFGAVVFDFMITRTYPVLVYPVLAIILAIGWYTFYTDTDYGDADPGAFTGMQAQQSVVDYLEANNCYDKTIGSGSFLENQHLLLPASGFLHTQKAFTKVRWEIDASTDYALFDDIEPDSRYKDIKASPDFRLVYRFEKGRVWAEIYKRNH